MPDHPEGPEEAVERVQGVIDRLNSITTQLSHSNAETRLLVELREQTTVLSELDPPEPEAALAKARKEGREEVRARLEAERREAIRVVGHRVWSHPLITTMDENHRNRISTVLDALLESGARPGWEPQEQARKQLLEEVREALGGPLRNLRSLAARLHDASDAERACATGAQFTRGLVEDIEAAIDSLTKEGS